MTKNESLTLEQLEKDIWAESDFGSYLVTTCHNLRQKRLIEFTVEDLRIMIGQGIGLKYLLPKALELLRENPLVSGDLYDGDLLVTVIKQVNSAPRHYPSISVELVHVCRCASEQYTLWHLGKNAALISDFAAS